MKSLYTLLLTTLFFLLVSGCSAPIDRSEVFPRDEPIEIRLDFRFAENYDDPGYIQFINLSEGMKSYFWEFGYKDDNGTWVTSKLEEPYVFFPENREYVVVLTGIDFRGEKHQVRQWVPVVYRCC